MKYKGIELVPITEPQIFDPPKEMLVWDVERLCETSRKAMVYAVTTRESLPVIGLEDSWNFCAEIPEEPKKMCEFCERKTSTKDPLTIICQFSNNYSTNITSDLKQCSIGIPDDYGVIIKNKKFSFCPVCGQKLGE